MRLHPKHGVNPTIPVCYFCGSPRSEVVLLGAGYKGEAPMHMVIDKRPCLQCENVMKEGVLFIEVADKTDPKDPYRTGRMVGLKEEAVKGMFQEEMEQTIFQSRCAFLEREAFEKLFGHLLQDQKEEETPKEDGC